MEKTLSDFQDEVSAKKGYQDRHDYYRKAVIINDYVEEFLPDMDRAALNYASYQRELGRQEERERLTGPGSDMEQRNGFPYTEQWNAEYKNGFDHGYHFSGEQPTSIASDITQSKFGEMFTNAMNYRGIEVTQEMADAFSEAAKLFLSVKIDATIEQRAEKYALEGPAKWSTVNGQKRDAYIAGATQQHYISRKEGIEEGKRLKEAELTKPSGDMEQRAIIASDTYMTQAQIPFRIGYRHGCVEQDLISRKKETLRIVMILKVWVEEVSAYWQEAETMTGKDLTESFERMLLLINSGQQVVDTWAKEEGRKEERERVLRVIEEALDEESDTEWNAALKLVRMNIAGKEEAGEGREQ